MAFDLTAFPFSSGAGASSNVDRWEDMARWWSQRGVIRHPDSPLSNRLAVFADSTGMQVKVPAGALFVDGFYGESTAQQTVALATSDPSNPRIDLVIARLNLTPPEKIEITILTGTAAVSPSAPALTNSSTIREMELAQIAVSAGASTIAAGNVTDKRTYARGAGAPIRCVARLSGTLTNNTGFFSAAHPATGRVVFTFTEPMLDTLYTVVATPYSTASLIAVLYDGSQTTAGFEIRTYVSNTGSAADAAAIGVTVFRDD